MWQNAPDVMDCKRLNFNKNAVRVVAIAVSNLFFLLLLTVAPVWSWADDNFADRQELILWELDIKGNQQIPTETILSAIQSTESSHAPKFIAPLLGGRHEFYASVFRDDLKRIERLYRRSGYFKAKVVQSDFKPCSREHLERICATLTIEEGPPTLILGISGNVENGTPPVTPEEVVPQFGMRAGQLFNHDDYMKAKEGVVRYLMGRHYPLPQVTGEAVYDPKSNDVAIHLDIRPGTAARIGHVKFIGLQLLLEEDVQKRVPLKTGEWFNPTKFERAQERLQNLDVFASLETKLVPRPNDPSVVDVEFHVREKPFKSLSLGFGIGIENSRQEVSLRGEWTNRNFYKRLRTFTVRGEPRYAILPSVFRPEQMGPLGTLEISLLQPHFPAARDSLRLATGFDADLEQAFRWYGPRVSANVEHVFSRKLAVSGGYAFSYLTFYNVSVGFQPQSRLVPPQLFGASRYRLGFLDQAVTWDDRNNRIETTRGNYFTLRLAESAPFLGSSFTYLRAMPEVRKYIPFSSRSIFAARARFGRLIPLRNQASPITERFYSGGADSHRGFSYHRLSPQVNTGDGRPVPVGGDVMVEFSVEKRFRLTQLGGQWLVGTIFLDAGDVVETVQALDFRYLHYAVGPGLRYQTPVGAIRADVGFRLNRLSEQTAGRPNPDPGDFYAIHLSLGEAF